MTIVVPLQPIANQAVTTALNNQDVQLNVYQKSTGLYVDLYMNNNPVPTMAGMLGYNLRPMILSAYLGFVGELVFIDIEGDLDPYYTGLGTRFNLVYLLPSELPASFPFQ